ncbi:hypothetical protein FDV98_04135 [Escherichia coli]
MVKSVISKEVTDFLFMGWRRFRPFFNDDGKLLIISAGEGKDKKGCCRRMGWFCFINNGLNV